MDYKNFNELLELLAKQPDTQYAYMKEIEAMLGNRISVETVNPGLRIELWQRLKDMTKVRIDRIDDHGQVHFRIII